MAEKKDNITFVIQDPTGLYKRALVFVDEGETIGQNDTITLDEHEYRVEDITSVRAHVRETGESQQYSYDGNELKKETENDSRDVIEILFRSDIEES